MLANKSLGGNLKGLKSLIVGHESKDGTIPEEIRDKHTIRYWCWRSFDVANIINPAFTPN